MTIVVSTRSAVGAFVASCALAACPCMALYPSDPVSNLPVVAQPGSQTVQKAATHQSGATWVAWWDNSGGNFVIRAQLLDPYGRARFAPQGLLVSSAPQDTSLNDWDMIVDSAGNAVMVYNDIRDGADRDIHAQMVTPLGAMPWGPNGVTISMNDDFEADPRIVQDKASGHYLIVWPRLGNSGGAGLYMQRLNASGVPQLASGGVRIVGDGVENPAFVEMVAPPGGGLIAVWARDTRLFSSPRHVHAQKFDANGAGQWNGGNTVIVSNAASMPIAFRPRIALGPNGGVALAWSDSREGGSNCFVQRLNGSGAPQFATNGESVSTNASRIRFEPWPVFVDNTVEVICFYNDRNGAQSIRAIGAQRFAANGARLMGPNGEDILPFDDQNKTAPRGLPSAGGATMVVTVEPDSSIGNFNAQVVAMRIDTIGHSVWTPGVALVMSEATGTKGRLLATVDGAGNVRAVWEDNRNGNNDVYAQLVLADGTLGTNFTCPEDTDQDGVVGFSDFSAVLSTFGQSGIYFPGDVNNDGVVNFTDFSAVLAQYGEECP